MAEFQSFDSLEEMFASMRTNEDTANQTLADEQANVTYGDCWIRFYDIPTRVFIYGYVPTLDEMREAETNVTLSPDETPEEILAEADESVEMIRESHERGYMYGQAYSMIEPSGEWGSTHRANLWPIPRWLYDEARAVGWEADALSLVGKAEVQRVYTAWRSHELAKAAHSD